MSALGVPRVGANVSANDDVPDAVYTCPLAVVEPAPPPRFAVLLAAAALVVTGVCIGRAIGFFLVAFV